MTGQANFDSRPPSPGLPPGPSIDAGSAVAKTGQEAIKAAPAGAGTLTAPSGTTHTVTRELSSNVKWTAQKVGMTILGFIGFIVALALLPITLIAGGVLAHKSGKIIDRAKGTTETVKKMKNAEETAKLDALRKVATGWESQSKEIRKTEFSKSLIDVLKKNGFTDAEIAAKQKDIEKFSETVISGDPPLVNALVTNDEMATRVGLLEGIVSCVRSFRITEQAMKTHLDNLFKILKDSAGCQQPKEIAEANQKFLRALRATHSSQAYQEAQKANPNHPSVRLVQNFALAMYRGVTALGAFRDLGKTILDAGGPKVESESKSSESPRIDGKALAERLEHSQERFGKQYYTDHGLAQKLAYARTHTDHSTASLASEGVWKRELAGLMAGERGEVYDSHAMTLANNPSIQGTTTFTQGTATVSIDNVYGGSPTIGDDHLSPEFLAVLDGVETRSSDAPHMVLYTNFQNICNPGGEGARSRTIMEEQARRPPGTFLAITLPKDSGFYKGADEAWKGLDNVGQFGDRMLHHMLDPNSFTLEHRTTTQKGQGFYFPGGKEKWEGVLTAIRDDATEHFRKQEAELSKSKPLSANDRKQLFMAYQEYVYSMVQGAMESMAAQELIKQGITAPRMMAIRACKENIDRGGAENTKYLYTRYANTPTADPRATEDLLAGVMHSRALSARDRMILEHRTAPLMSFMRHVEPDVFRNRQEVLLKRMYSTGTPTFRPALPPEPPSTPTP